MEGDSLKGLHKILACMKPVSIERSREVNELRAFELSPFDKPALNPL